MFSGEMQIFFSRIGVLLSVIFLYSICQILFLYYTEDVLLFFSFMLLFGFIHEISMPFIYKYLSDLSARHYYIFLNNKNFLFDRVKLVNVRTTLFMFTYWIFNSSVWKDELLQIMTLQPIHAEQCTKYITYNFGIRADKILPKELIGKIVI